MSKNTDRRNLTRRNFLKVAGGTLATAAGARFLPGYWGKDVLQPTGVEVASAQGAPPDLYLAGTDGWAYLPPSPAIPPFHPDDLAPAPFNTYMFGFRDVTGMTETQKLNQKEKTQTPSPMFWMDQSTPTAKKPFRLQLTNLGLAFRPDLTDAHTIHFHGLRNAIPFFDGEPHGSVSVPIGRDFTYVYHVYEPGTYMYHCHVEDVEHVQMGMTGMVFVRPEQDGNTTHYPSGKYAYNCGDGSTGFDREFVMLLTEIWAEAHWVGSHVQSLNWSDLKPEFFQLNGRTYPDTLLPNSTGAIDPGTSAWDANGDLLITSGLDRLQYQPYSSLVTCNEGERVLLRFANLGFTRQTMTLSGIKMHVVGKDATIQRGRDGTDYSHMTNSITMGAGSSYDAIFEAPSYVGPGPYDTYLLYNRNYSRINKLDGSGYGGQMTEVRVYPTSTLPVQTLPNT